MYSYVYSVCIVYSYVYSVCIVCYDVECDCCFVSDQSFHFFHELNNTRVYLH